MILEIIDIGGPKPEGGRCCYWIAGAYG